MPTLIVNGLSVVIPLLTSSTFKTSPDHDDSACSVSLHKCCNCHGPHAATYTRCPMFQYECEVLLLQLTMAFTRQHAREELCSQGRGVPSATSRLYSTAVASSVSSTWPVSNAPSSVSFSRPVSSRPKSSTLPLSNSFCLLSSLPSSLSPSSSTTSSAAFSTTPRLHRQPPKHRPTISSTTERPARFNTPPSVFLPSIPDSPETIEKVQQFLEDTSPLIAVTC